MNDIKCEFDKYGCTNGLCREHYPVISRESIISEMDASEELRYCECEKRCDNCGRLIK